MSCEAVEEVGAPHVRLLPEVAATPTVRSNIRTASGRVTMDGALDRRRIVMVRLGKERGVATTLDRKPAVASSMRRKRSAGSMSVRYRAGTLDRMTVEFPSCGPPCIARQSG